MIYYCAPVDDSGDGLPSVRVSLPVHVTVRPGP